MVIPMLWKLIQVIKLLCKTIDIAAPRIRPFVPADKVAVYDTHVEGLKSACALMLDMDWLDSNPNTTDALKRPPT